MLVFYLFSLLLAIITINYYISSGIRVGIHRLLPMTAVAIAIHDICQLGILMFGQNEMFVVFDDLLMIEILFVLTHYIREFYYIRFRRRTEIMLGTAMFVMAAVAIMQYRYPLMYRLVYGAYTTVYLLLLIMAATGIMRHTYFSKKERMVVRLLYIGTMSACITLLFRKLTVIPGTLICSIVYDVVCLGAIYLIYSGRLIDDATLMQSNLFDTSDVAMVLFDPDFFLLEANRVAREKFPKDLGRGRREAQRDQFRESMRHFAESEDRVVEVEVGDSFYRCTVEDFNVGNELHGYILTVVDVTEEKLQVKRLERLKQQAEDQNVLKSKFLANMSHDLRSPLHAVMGASDVLLSKNNMTAMNRSYIQMIKNSSKVLLDLVNEILLYSKLEAGKLVLSQNPYSLEGMLKDLSQMMILNLAAKPVEFELSFDTAYPGEVTGDQMRTREIVQNILSNAVKFTEQGKISCNVSCEPDANRERVKVTCRISDTGPGMNREQLSNMFDEYASFANLRNKEGTGLGMSIVRQLTNLMGGTAVAESDGQSGSTVTISFYQKLEKDIWCQPVKYQKNDLIKRKVKLEQADLPSVAFMDAKVLVVDDLDVNLKVFMQIATRWGIQPDVAESGAKAIEMAKEKEYHLIFLDLMMPEMDGVETAIELQKFTDTPLILLTADASDETRRKSMEAGFADYMQKPIENARLEANLEKFIPKEYRVAVNKSAAVTESVQNEEILLAHRSILETVVAELQQLYLHLPEYQKNDMTMFRIKVHGIKGFTRQINRFSISRQAEIMEMAAKTDNQRFILENMDDFLLEIKETIEEITEELVTLPKREVKQSKETVDELFVKLKAAFDDFDLRAAEGCVAQLQTRELSAEEQALAEQCAQACEDIDYEAGSELLKKYT